MYTIWVLIILFFPAVFHIAWSHCVAQEDSGTAIKLSEDNFNKFFCSEIAFAV